MRAICLSVAGLVLGAVVPALAQPPTILSFAELKTLEGLWAAHPGDRELTEKLASNYGLDALGILGFKSTFGVTGWASTEPELALRSYAREALARATSADILGGAGQTMFNYAGVNPDTSLRDMAQVLIDRAIEAKPTDERWRTQRIYSTILRTNSSRWKPLTTTEAYRLVKADFDSIAGNHAAYLIGKVAFLAFLAGKLDDAELLGNQLITRPETDRDHGEAVFKGNSVLGLVALKRGNTEAAKRDLLKAGDTTGSPTLDSFGPNMTLAEALIGAGQRDVVLQYFEQCRKFWKLGQGRLDQWTDDVKAGKTPKFGANLIY